MDCIGPRACPQAAHKQSPASRGYPACGVKPGNDGRERIRPEHALREAIENFWNLLQNLRGLFGVVHTHDCIDSLHLRVKRIEPRGFEASMQFRIHFCFLEHEAPQRNPAAPGQSHMTSVPQTPDGKHIAVAKLAGAGFKPALVPQARCESIAVISCAIEVRTAKLGSTSHTVNAERGRVCGAPQKTHT